MVERGGVLLGQVDSDQVQIARVVWLENAATEHDAFVYLPGMINPYLTRPDFVGLFHTHRFWPWPGWQDLKSGKALARELDREIIVGIVRREVLRLWRFVPGKFWPTGLSFTLSEAARKELQHVAD